MDADRCRLIAVSNPKLACASQLIEIAQTRLVACCILYTGDVPQVEFFEYAEQIVPAFHDVDLPVLIAEDLQAMAYSNADGLYIEQNRHELGSYVEKIAPEKMIGCGGFRKRHGAMQAGEANPDFVLMGRLGGDIRPGAHPKNIEMARWWTDIIDIPCAVTAGYTLDSIIECVNTGAEFVALERAFFSDSAPVAELVQQADQLLQEHAPRFNEVS